VLALYTSTCSFMNQNFLAPSLHQLKAILYIFYQRETPSLQTNSTTPFAALKFLSQNNKDQTPNTVEIMSLPRPLQTKPNTNKTPFSQLKIKEGETPSSSTPPSSSYISFPTSKRGQIGR